MGSDVWVLGRRCVGCGSMFWVGWARVLGRWWCHGYVGGWLSFGPAVFVAVVG